MRGAEGSVCVCACVVTPSVSKTKYHFHYAVIQTMSACFNEGKKSLLYIHRFTDKLELATVCDVFLFESLLPTVINITAFS